MNFENGRVFYVGKNAKLYVGCVKNGKIINSKPCWHCLQYIKTLKFIKYIVYSTENGWKVEKVIDMHTEHISKGNRK